MDLGLQGKKAIVVGGARGIGYAVAEILAREGADVAISARGEDGVKDAVAALSRYGTKVVGKPCNVKKADDYKAWLEWAIEALEGAKRKALVPDLLNLNDAYIRQHGRTKEQLVSALQTGRRYLIGARYRF